MIITKCLETKIFSLFTLNILNMYTLNDHDSHNDILGLHYV